MENNDKIMDNNISCASRYNCSINDGANSKTWHWTVSSIHSAHLDPNVQYITSVWKSFRAKNIGFGFYMSRLALLYPSGF